MADDSENHTERRPTRAEERRRRREMVDAWRSQEYRRRSRPGETGLSPRFVVAAIAVAILGVAIWISKQNGSGTDATDPTQPDSSPSTSASAPFANSPAASYADGADGITVPRAAPVGGYSAVQVAAAYAATKRLLVAAGLDHQTLTGGAPQAFEAQLPGFEQTWFRANLNTKKSSRSLVISLAPGSARLVGDTVKVHGIMSPAVPMTQNNATGLQVKVDFLFVYALSDPSQPSDIIRLVARISGDNLYASTNGSSYNLVDWSTSSSPTNCDFDTGFIRPYFAATQPETIQPTGHPIDPYDLNTAIDTAGCRSSKGT